MNKLSYWFKKNIPLDNGVSSRLKQFKELNINTVCESAHCPNIVECFDKNRASFMILGDSCSRNCSFCDVETGDLIEVDSFEPENIAKAIKDLGLTHAVITSVTRDDLDDFGASQFALTVQEIRKYNPEVIIETLIPDFNGYEKSISVVVGSKPDIVGHNLETVERLYNKIRPEANYKQSLKVLKMIKDLNSNIFTKSGIMLGLGENIEEIIKAMNDLRKVNCDILTLGQYLAPSENHYKVDRFVVPEEFEALKDKAISLGFKSVASGPWVRSSYFAQEIFKECTT